MLSFLSRFRAAPSLPESVRATVLSLELIDEAMIESIVEQNGHILVTLKIAPAQASVMEPVRQQAETRIAGLKSVKSVRVMLTAEREGKPQPHAQDPAHQARLAPDVKHIIAVASGKGGVGKSTVAVNLAIALAQSGLAVGLLDADIYGPSIPTMLGLAGEKPVQDGAMLLPLQAHGISTISMGSLVGGDTPMIWRGPMVQSAITQLLRDVKWGALDVLVLDMPPGTGDAQLTVAQKVPLKGAVIVSTPQDIAWLDAAKGIEMFRKVGVPVLGVVENMSQFCCPNCHHVTPIFGPRMVDQRAAEKNVAFLGDIPLEMDVRQAGDTGLPITVARPDHPVAQRFAALAQAVRQALAIGDNRPIID